MQITVENGPAASGLGAAFVAEYNVLMVLHPAMPDVPGCRTRNITRRYLGGLSVDRRDGWKALNGILFEGIGHSASELFMEPSMQIDVPFKCGGKRMNSSITASRVDPPLVTVVTAVLNGQPHIAGCLESVLSQDYPNIEHIVLDGGSTDGTLDVLLRYSDRIALWRSEPDKGIYDAWNKALAEARGEWICFLGSDDEFLPGAITAYMAQVALNPKAEYLCSEGRLLAPSGKERVIGRPWKWQEFLRRMDLCHVGSMHKRTLFQKLGAFDSSYRIAGDYEFLLRPRSELRAAFLPAVTVYVRAGGVCYSSKVMYETYRAKHETGGLSKLFALLDLSRDHANYRARLLARRILKRLSLGTPAA